jgi:hypothetical protein
VLRAGHAQHIAKRAEDHVGLGGDRQSAVDLLQRGDAHRAAGAVHQLDLGRQQLVEAVAHNGVGLPAADFHQHPRAGDRAPDFIDHAAHQFGVAKFSDKLHDTFQAGCDGRLLAGSSPSSSSNN